MSTRTIFTIAVLWVLSLFAVGTIVKAQAYRINPLPEPKVVSGPDFGIRIDGERNGKPVGLLVVRVDGKWLEAQLGSVNRGTELLR